MITSRSTIPDSTSAVEVLRAACVRTDPRLTVWRRFAAANGFRGASPPPGSALSDRSSPSISTILLERNYPVGATGPRRPQRMSSRPRPSGSSPACAQIPGGERPRARARRRRDAHVDSVWNRSLRSRRGSRSENKRCWCAPPSTRSARARALPPSYPLREVRRAGGSSRPPDVPSPSSACSAAPQPARRSSHCCVSSIFWRGRSGCRPACDRALGVDHRAPGGDPDSYAALSRGLPAPSLRTSDAFRQRPSTGHRECRLALRAAARRAGRCCTAYDNAARGSPIGCTHAAAHNAVRACPTAADLTLEPPTRRAIGRESVDRR